MKRFFKFICFLLPTATFLISCTKDKEDPTISVMEPAENEIIHWGATLHAEAMFADDKKLSSYHVHIGDSLGNHIPEWDWESEANIKGKEFEFHEHIVVPNDVPDSVWVHYEVTDAVGKTAETEIFINVLP